MAENRKRKFWGWGYEDQGPTPEQQKHMAERMAKRFGLGPLEIMPPPKESELTLRAPRVKPPAALEAICSTATHERAGHTYGKGSRDIRRAFRRDYPNPIDVVAFPRDEKELIRVLEWCDGAQIAAVPYGGGSSVVGGVEPPEGDRYRGAVSIDLIHLDKVVEVDKVSRAARIQAGVYGPALDAQLKPHALTIRPFPQSFEFSTLGGWIATRSGGHFATLYTHIDDFVESLRVVTPAGIVESRRLPGSGAGPSPDRMFIGSEGILGIITQAWMRLQDRPTFRAGGAIHFADFFTAAKALRAVSQAGLYPATCRILDPQEASNTGAGDGSVAIMVLAFESGDHPVEPWMARARECCADHGGKSDRTDAADAHREGAAGAWRNAFIRMPYARERTIERGIINDTFETAITWDRFESFHDKVKVATERAILEATGGRGQVTCRCTQ